MRQVLANPQTEIEQLRAEITKWRQRVPKLTEMLRLRADSLTQLERQNHRLREELESARQLIAETDVAKETHLTVASASSELRRENQQLFAARARLEREQVSLESRNRLLQQTVEILTLRLEDAVAELGRLRSEVSESRERSVDRSQDSVVDNPRILLRIRGIGEKTLGLLEQAGIRSLESLAELPEVVLDDPDCPLFPHRTRIRRQRWVAQARELVAYPESPPSV